MYLSPSNEQTRAKMLSDTTFDNRSRISSKIFVHTQKKNKYT